MRVPAFRRYRVLVAEDDLQGAKLISMVLKKLGFEDIHVTENGEDAWNMIDNATAPFHLVISDWNMPQLTGLELLQRVRKTNLNLPFCPSSYKLEQSTA